MPTYKRILNCIPSRDTEKDWRVEHAVRAGLHDVARSLLPSVDLRESWWKVGDQLDTGSCVGWAAVEVLRWHYVRAGWLDKNEPLSPRFIWMAAKEFDQYVSMPTTFIEAEGTSIKAALDIARKFGAVRDTMLPFESGRMFREDARTFYAAATALKIASYYRLEGVGEWKRWLAEEGPVLTRLNVDRSWDEIAGDGHLDVYDSGSTYGGHAVAMVGYTADPRIIIRNSWGDSWGHGGFAYASLPYAEAAFTEAYGLKL